MDEKERAAFEAWCQRIGFTTWRSVEGEYLSNYGAELWSGWKARAALAAAPAPAPKWQPAGIAPTETGLYLVRIGAQTHVAQFNLRTSTAQWWNAYGSPSRLAQQPTHWMPLPEPPEGATP